MKNNTAEIIHLPQSWTPELAATWTAANSNNSKCGLLNVRTMSGQEIKRGRITCATCLTTYANEVRDQPRLQY